MGLNSSSSSDQIKITATPAAATRPISAEQPRKSLAPCGVLATVPRKNGTPIPKILPAISRPPYDLWEHPPAVGKIPPHGSDAGSYLVGEVFGARSVILLKDVDGLYTADPKNDSRAALIDDIGVAELRDRKLPTLPIEPVLLDLLANAKLVKSIRIVNGLVPGNLTRALKGEPVGTLIHV